MDNQRLAYSGLYLFWFQHKYFCLRIHCLALNALTHALAIATVTANLHADTFDNTSKVMLREQQHYTAELPDEFNGTIPFRWHYLPTSEPMPSSLGNTWRHSYDLRLLQNEDKLELLKPDGTRQLFSPRGGNVYVADKKPDRTIKHKLQHYHLETPEGTTIFFGSYPIATKRQDNSVIKLRYKNGVLSRLLDKDGNNLQLRYADNGALVGIIQADSAFIKFEYDQHNRLASSRSPSGTNRYVYPTSPPVVLCTTTTPEIQLQTPQQLSPDHSCDVSHNPPPSSFQLSQLNPHSIKIDLRPQSCRSYFVDYNGIDRGVKLEVGMLTNARYSNLLSTVRSFPVVDFIDGREAVAVYTKDLTSKTYRPNGGQDGLYKSILQDAQKADDKFLTKLQNLGFVSANEKGVTTTITQSQIDSLRMEVMIQAGVATPMQLAQIERARITLLAKWNIKLLVVIIP